MSPPPVSEHVVMLPQSWRNRQGQAGVCDTDAVNEHHGLTGARRGELQLDAIDRYAFHRLIAPPEEDLGLPGPTA